MSSLIIYAAIINLHLYVTTARSDTIVRHFHIILKNYGNYTQVSTLFDEREKEEV